MCCTRSQRPSPAQVQHGEEPTHGRRWPHRSRIKKFQLWCPGCVWRRKDHNEPPQRNVTIAAHPRRGLCQGDAADGAPGFWFRWFWFRWFWFRSCCLKCGEYYLPRWGTSDGTWNCTLTPTYTRWGTRKCNVCAGLFLGKSYLVSKNGRWHLAVIGPYLQLPEACSSPNLRDRSQPSALHGPSTF